MQRYAAIICPDSGPGGGTELHETQIAPANGARRFVQARARMGGGRRCAPPDSARGIPRCWTQPPPAMI